MAKDPSLISCNSASVVDSMPRYFAFHGVDPGSGPDPVTIFFIKVWKMHQIPAFELVANAQRNFQLSQKSKETIFKKFVALPGTRTREPESSQQKSKSVARYPLGY